MGKGKTDRNAPKRAPSSESRYSILEFRREFPDDATCLEYLVAKLYPDGIYCPNEGTIFQGSSTSLHLWFEAIYLMASTRCGISAKQVERELGVTYPTAWRMAKQIRSLLEQDDDFLGGTVELDETYVGGKR